jgi:hypothetical protein
LVRQTHASAGAKRESNKTLQADEEMFSSRDRRDSALSIRIDRAYDRTHSVPSQEG